MSKQLKGLIAATLTPFNAKGDLALDAIPPFVEHLIEMGVDGLFTCGTTGESSSLTLEERKVVSEAYATANAGRLPLVVHVGHACLKDSQHLAAHAATLGADAIAALPPYYFKPPTIEILVDSLAEIASGAPKTPLYYYHIPVLSGMTLNIVDLLPLAEEKLPSFAGVKFTYENLMDYSSSLTYGNGKYNILFGRDEMLLAGLAMGATSAVGSTYNVMMAPYRRLREAFARGDMPAALREQRHAIALIQQMVKYGGFAILKCIARWQGYDMGHPRLPLRTLNASEEASLKTALAGIPDLH
ncbi:MAG: dihydrodipicolinate synthase family protein [Planctomycetes bacterium]|nr:dihydrodipicolinate synthase family protein [Planctomycetota bacterium]